MKDVRCGSGILFGRLDENTMVFETKCRSRRCGAGQGVVVIHRFSCNTGELLSTRSFQDPSAIVSRRNKKEGEH